MAGYCSSGRIMVLCLSLAQGDLSITCQELASEAAKNYRQIARFLSNDAVSLSMALLWLGAEMAGGMAGHTQEELLGYTLRDLLPVMACKLCLYSNDEGDEWEPVEDSLADLESVLCPLGHALADDRDALIAREIAIQKTITDWVAGWGETTPSIREVTSFLLDHNLFVPWLSH